MVPSDLDRLVGPVGVAEAVAEGVDGGAALLLPGAVADEDALAVREFAVVRDDLGDRGVGEGAPGGGEAAAGLVGAGQDVGEGGAALLAGEPAEQDGGDLVAPRQFHRGAGVDDHDGVRVGGGDRADQVVLAAGQRQVLAVEALGLDAFGGGDHDDGRVGGAGGLDGLGDQLVGRRAAGPGGRG